MTISDATTHWQDRLRTIADEVGVAGASLGIRFGEVSVDVAHGVLNTATGVDATPDSLFQIGSITKVWTATMIMQLIDEGRLTLESSVADLLPGTRIGVRDVSSEVTVRHLLTHASGIDGDVFTDTGRGDECVERYVGLLGDAANNHPVGGAYSYCNSGFSVLGRIIEVLDGTGWDAALRARLVEPLGLGHTVTLPEEAILHRAAVGHRDHPHQDKPVEVWALPRSVGPVGLIAATPADVLAFARLHQDGGVAPDGTRLLSADAVAAMQEPQRPIPGIDGRGDAVGLAWRLNRWGGRRVIGHDGGTIGQLAYLRVVPDAGLAVCLLTNASVSMRLYQELFTEIFDEYLGIAPPPIPEPSGRTRTSDPSRFAGTYARSSVRYEVTVEGDDLHLLATPTGPLASLAEHESESFVLAPAGDSDAAFVIRSHDAEPWTWLVFERLDDGTPYVFLGGRATPLVATS